MISDKREPLLSIIVPVYKVEKYLKRCINSILEQKFKDFEVILVDDGSPDDSGNICDEYCKIDNRIKTIHKRNGGLGSARNAGIKIANGKYIGFIDSDDWISNDMYSFLIKNALEYEADIVSCSYVLVKEKKIIRKKKYFVKCLEGEEKLIDYLKCGMKYRISDYSVCNKIYRKELFNNIKFPEGQLYEDVTTNFRLIKSANKYVKSNKVTYYYFQDNSSITRNYFTVQDFDILKVSKEMVELSKDERNKEIILLAHMKEARAYFSMLCKIALYGMENNVINKGKIITELTCNLRKNYLLLLKSSMPLNRKIIMTLLCINIKLVILPTNFYKAIKKILLNKRSR